MVRDACCSSRGLSSVLGTHARWLTAVQLPETPVPRALVHTYNPSTAETRTVSLGLLRASLELLGEFHSRLVRYLVSRKQYHTLRKINKVSSDLHTCAFASAHIMNGYSYMRLLHVYLIKVI